MGGNRSMRKTTLAVLLVAICLAFSLPAISAESQKTPVPGGILRIVSPTGPAVIGYYKEMGPADLAAAFPAVEALMDYTSRRELKPWLAEKVDINEKDLTITFHIRKGVKFHDGTDLNADCVAYNFNYLKELKRLQCGDKVKAVEIVGPYTVRLRLTEYNNMLIHGLGWVFMWSKQALSTQSPDWLRANPVGTGPFRLVEWKRDSHIKWTRNKDYWQKGKPYLDGIEIRYIPDSVTTSQMMQKKEADMWMGAPLRDQTDLEKKGFVRNYGYAGLPTMIYLNTTNPDKPTGKLKVREAIEYAIDKAAMAKALGFGYATPLKMTSPEGEWGYDPTYQGRSYDPAKTKQLLAEAGYASGCKLKIMGLGDASKDALTAIKSFMDQAGFEVDIDIADPGRFFGSFWGKGFEDMALLFTGLDPTYLVTFQRWFSHDPATNVVSFKRSPELIALSKESLKYNKEADQKSVTKKLVRMMADEANVIPLYYVPAAYLTQPYVHSNYYKEGFIRWRTADDWMEKH
jgi:peptide/nickel transport system substrate-binding protein